MNRRRLLAAVGTGTIGAGAVGTSLVASDANPPRDATHAVSVERVREFASDTPLRARLELVERWATPDGPPAIRIRLYNPSLVPYAPTSGSRHVFSTSLSDDRNPAVALRAVAGAPSPIRAGSQIDPEAPPGCWRARHPGIAIQPLAVNRLRPFQALWVRLQLLGYDADDPVCLPTGTFNFTDRYRFEDRSDPVEWGFRLRIERV